MRKIDECGIESFGDVHKRKKTIAIQGDRWCSPRATHEGDETNKNNDEILIKRNAMNARTLEASQ